MSTSFKDILKITASSWSGFSALIDRDRRIHYVNPSFFTKAGESPEQLEGRYLEEIFGCSNHAGVSGPVCGTLQNCTYCRVYQAVNEAFKTGDIVREEASMSTTRSGKYQYFYFHVLAQPFRIPEGDFLFLSLEDITEQRRKRTLERVFYHDILNTVASLTMNISILEECDSIQDCKRHILPLEHIVDNLTEEIQRQRLIGLAESGRLEVEHAIISVKDFLMDIVEYFEEQSAKKGKKINLESSDSFIFVSDRSLLRRVLVNLLKNALEAVESGEEVSLSFGKEGDLIRFDIANSGVIPEDGRHLIFHQFYSTKGLNRGLGTYSVKILTENFLNGEASFKTGGSENRTVFTIKIPDLREYETK